MEQIIVGIGEALWDCLPEGKKLGGAPANFAFHTAQFGYHSMAISAVGNDKLGEETLAEFEKKQVNYLMPQVNYPTGTVQVSLDDNGIPTYEIKERVAWDNIPFTPEIETVAKQCKAVCFGSLAQRNSVSKQTIQKFIKATPNDCLKIFDINLRNNFYSKEIVCHSMEQCNVLKINDEELMILGELLDCADVDTEGKCKFLLDKYNIEILVLTCGVNGSYVFASDFQSFQETPNVEVADTVGAGDSFTAAFTAALLAGISLKEAHKLAVQTSAFVCTQNGAMPIIPNDLLYKVKQK